MKLYGSLLFGPNKLDEHFADVKTQVDLTESLIDGGGAVTVLSQDPVRLTTGTQTSPIANLTLKAISQQVLPAAILVAS